ncbi:putative Ig domain-containing protein [Bradyrhizobium oligotrophicum]|uniref:putative Ig domain-containing protein n=1 Tax=Bradyrhizobium oligotrophicum TaxID=44255 RepID=UPI003EBF7304
MQLFAIIIGAWKTSFQRFLTRWSSAVGNLRTLAVTTFVVLAAMGASISSAQAVCDLTVNSTTGATITFNSVSQVYHLCLTVVGTPNTGDDAVVYGLYSVSGTNANTQLPIAGTSSSAYSDYSPTTSKANYTLHPSSGNDNGQSANTGQAQINITLNSLTGGGQDTITLFYASDCSDFLVTCSGSGTALTSWTITVNLPGPTATQAIASKALTVNTATTSFTPVTGSGGTAPLGYGIVPSLPTGLSFNTSTGAITGTPTITSTATTYTVTVTDANSATASNTFSLTVNGAVTATQAVASKTLTQNHATTSFTPVTGGGGTTPYTFSILPSLPSGLSLNTSTGAITGTPTATSGSTTYTVTVTDANSATASNTFSLAVNAAVTATQSVASKILTQNAAATSFTPVTGGNGTPPLTYGVSPALPSGLTLDTNTGAITGTPTVSSGATTYTVTVTDANSATASNTFSLTVNTAVTATQSVSSATVTVNTAITTFTPVTGGGGTTPRTYAIAPTLPTGLSFNTSTGQVSGTPTVTSSTTTYTVTVTDANNGTASNTFQLTVNGPVSATQAIASKALTQNTAATSFTPVTGSGGTPPLSYSVAPALPTGLTLNTSTGAITGTPTATSGATTYTVTVTDANSATASNTFSLTVNSAVTATQAIASRTFTANQAITAFTPVTGGGGTGALSYSISPSLPAGLSINTSTGAISGTPSTSAATATYTVTVTDTNNGTATNTFSLTVNGAVSATQSIPAKSLTVNVAATSFTPVTGGGGTSPLTYGIAPALPAGLSFNTSTGAITGTPTAISTAATYTVTVSDANSASASNTFSLTINGAVTATQAIASKGLTVNTPVASFTPVTGAGGTSPLSYGIAPALPAGLTFNTSSGAITGTPTATSGATTYTVTVTDANSATATNTFSLAVNGAVSATQAIAATTLTANHAVTPFTPVTGGGGTAPLTYSVAPTLPAGLSLNTANGSISGTPTVTIAATTFTVTVTDAANATATNTFSLTINGAVTATTVVPSSALPINQAVTPFTPVAGSGGTGALVFAVSPALPAGLSFNTSNGQITGTPTAPAAMTTYTVTVTDTNSASANATFNLSVGQLVTTVALTSSQNPSQFGQPVTFTATVSASGGTPTGTVTFNDNGSPIGTVTLAGGVATFATSTLAVGSHTVTASYAGSALFTASTSPALAQTVNVPVDSVRLRSLQQTVSKLVAQNSGQAISGAIDDAIADGFSDGGPFMSPGNMRMRFNFSADPRDQDEPAPTSDRAAAGGSDAYSSMLPGREPPRGRSRGRIDDAFASIDRGDKRQAAPKWHEQKEWLLWADVRGTGVDRFGTTNNGGITQANQVSLYGQQLNAMMGLTYRATPSFLVGVLGGYETFSYTQQEINGKLKGDGWTTGAYLGWKIVPTLRFDAAVAYSGIGYDGTAGTAQGNFSGQRWMLSTGLTGTYKLAGVVLEPSTKIYALWEHQNAYTDSLGTRQGTNDFASGRASGGLRAAYPVAWLDSGVLLTPFLGMYGDYYFNKEDANTLAAGALASTPLLQGWSARFTGGLGIQTEGGAGVGLGAEYGGIGGNTRVWTFSARARVPFTAR